jgi:mannan endo-1,4-beta-mannosidase
MLKRFFLAVAVIIFGSGAFLSGCGKQVPTAATTTASGITAKAVPGVGTGLVNPNSTQATQNLYKFMSDEFQTNIISGVYGINDSNYIKSVSGKYPAIVTFDFMDYSPSRAPYGAVGTDTTTAINWANTPQAQGGGGIVGFSWHWNAPDCLSPGPWYSGFYTYATCFNLANTLANPGGTDYANMIRDLDAIAAQLQILQNAGIAVIWRPLHEAQGGWFWWGASGPGPYKQLYQLMWNRFVNVHHLNNLIWCWVANTGDNTSGNTDWYPGDQYVDVVVSDYATSQNTYNYMRSNFSSKLLALAECNQPDDPNSTPYLWDYFVTWAGFPQSKSTPSYLNNVYNNPKVITLDKLPDLANYHGPTPVPTATPLPTIVPPIGQTIWLKAQMNGDYVTTSTGEANAPLEARVTIAGNNESFTVVDAGNGLIALQSEANGLYVSAWTATTNAPLQARAAVVNTWEQYRLVNAGNGLVALQANANNLFVSAWNDPNQPLEARAAAVNTWEEYQMGTFGAPSPTATPTPTFTSVVVPPSDTPTAASPSATPTLTQVPPTYTPTALPPSPTSTPTAVLPTLTPTPAAGAPIGKTIWLKSQMNGLYVSAWTATANAPLQARSTAVNTWERFTVVDAGNGLIALQANANNLYVSAWTATANAPLEARAATVNTWEKFKWIDDGNGSISLQAQANNDYVSAWNDPYNLEARATAINTWEEYQWGQ